MADIEFMPFLAILQFNFLLFVLMLLFVALFFAGTLLTIVTTGLYCRSKNWTIMKIIDEIQCLQWCERECCHMAALDVRHICTNYGWYETVPIACMPLQDKNGQTAVIIVTTITQIEAVFISCWGWMSLVASLLPWCSVTSHNLILFGHSCDCKDISLFTRENRTHCSLIMKICYWDNWWNSRHAVIRKRALPHGLSSK